MSSGRKSQLEKFDARQAKAKAVDHHVQEEKAKAIFKENNKTIMERGTDIMKSIKPTTTTEDIFAVIARDSMESFMGLWNNSMENVIRETIRTEIKSVVREIVQEELQAAVRGVMTGVQQAMASQISKAVKEEAREGLLQTSTVSAAQEAMENITTKYEEAEAALEEFKGLDTDGDTDRKYKEPRYAKARIMTCGLCGEEGHNRRRCTKGSVTV